MKNQPKKTSTEEPLNEGESVLVRERKRGRAKHAPKNIPDETVEKAVVAVGGRTGAAAEALGVSARTVRRRTGSTAKNPSMRGLSARARAEFRRLLKRNVFQMLQDGNERVTIELMKTKVGRELGFAPDAQKVELSGKVDGDLRLGPLDERIVNERLKALGVEDEP